MKILKGTIIGGIVFFFLGWLIYGILLMDFSMANYNQCMNRAETDMIWWAMILSNFALALLLTLILKWSGAAGYLDGLKTGAIFGFLLGLSMDLSFYSMTTMYNNLSVMLVDIAVYSFMLAVVGMVIVLLWGKDKSA